MNNHPPTEQMEKQGVLPDEKTEPCNNEKSASEDTVCGSDSLSQMSEASVGTGEAKK